MGRSTFGVGIGGVDERCGQCDKGGAIRFVFDAAGLDCDKMFDLICGKSIGGGYNKGDLYQMDS